MYQREIEIPYQRPARNPAPVPPARRRRRRRRRVRRELGRFLVTFCILLTVCVLLANAAKPEDGSAETVLPPTAPVTAISAEEPEITDSVDKSAWNLTLVNPWNPLPEDYSMTLRQLSGGHSVDERCYPALQEMLDACRAEGLSPLICSSYRSYEKQQALYQNKINRLIAQGYSREKAAEEAGTVVALPGTSEHQLGLAVDIVDVNNQNLDTSQERTEVQKWLIEHSWEYGFILRYPNNKSEITGIIYEPWHYRYVGKDAAREIHTLGVCLEEYLDIQT